MPAAAWPAAQAAGALLVAAVLVRLGRGAPAPATVTWAQSWVVLAVAQAAAGASIAFETRAAGDPLRRAASAAWFAAALLQPLLVAVAGRERALARALPRALALAAATGLVGGAAAAAAGADPARPGWWSAAAAAAFLLACSSSRPAVRPAGVGARLLPLVLAGLAIAQLLGPAIDSDAWTAWLRPWGGLASVLHSALGVAMLTALLEDEREALGRAAARIEHQAYHDTVTGLPNRQMFLDRLQLALAQARRRQGRLGVLLIGLDRFRVINESLGHSVGDTLLRETARRLMDAQRQGDTVARIGGDEFAVLVQDLHDPGDAARVAQKHQDALRLPFSVEERELYLTATVGGSLYPDDGPDAAALLRCAHSALQRAKEEGRGSFHLYAPMLHARALERITLDSSLRAAQERGEFALHFQPVVELASGTVLGTEALLRWRHPARGLLAPGEFLEQAEVSGLLLSLGDWVLETACARTREWQDGGRPELEVAVNLSARQLADPELRDRVTRALERSGLRARFLELEVAESLALREDGPTAERLGRLKGLGVRIAIDGVGAGYGSLRRLRGLPVDTLKIDGSFVRDMRLDVSDAAVAGAVIATARGLGLRVVAEGVETADQLAFLSAHQCDRVQGRLLSPPVPAEQMPELFDRGDLLPG